MRIERIDDKTVKCFLSNEELEEYDIDYKDFVTRSEKAREVVQEIIEQAEEEVGYRAPKFAFDLQIMMVPDQGMVLTFSDKDLADIKGNEQLMECLRDMKEMLQKTKQQMNAAAQNPQGKATGDDGGSKSKAQTKANRQEIARPEDAVFVFDRIAPIMEYAKLMPSTLRVSSTLYVMDGVYFLHLKKGGAAYERYGRACVQALEFGYLYTAEEDQILHLKEHGECLIAEHALKKLRM